MKFVLVVLGIGGIVHDIFKGKCTTLKIDYWWLVELPMWLTDGFLVTFFGRWRGAVRIHVSHVQLTYMVTNV